MYEFKKGTYGTHKHECFWIFFEGKPLHKYVLTEDLQGVILEYISRGYSLIITTK